MTRLLGFAFAAALALPAAFAQENSAVQAAVQKSLRSSAFKNLQTSVQNGTVTLTGSVDLYVAKLNADRRVSRVHGVTAIRDEIQIAGSEIPDSQLQAQLENKLAVGRQTIYVKVHRGAVTVGGHADSSLHAFVIAAVIQTKGVRGFHDVIEAGGSPLQGEWPSAAPPIGGLSTP